MSMVYQSLNHTKPSLILSSSNSTPFLYNSKLFTHGGHTTRKFPRFSVLRNSHSKSEPNPKQKPASKQKPGIGRESEVLHNKAEESETGSVPIIPRKPRRGRKSEAVAVEDFIRDSLERTFESIQLKNPKVLEGKESIIRDKFEEPVDSDSDSHSDDEDEEDEDDDDDDDDEGKGMNKKKKMSVDEMSKDWPLDADVGWGIRASEYFEKHPIKNVVGDDGFEIDWEYEIDDNWVKEINCLEWESFAFHPSPLIVLVFERYNRATDNWKTLKELEKAAKVYWSAKDRLPPRTVKIDIGIERDLAYALKVKECPQILFLRGNNIMYREKEFRSSDELVQMIAHFYYNAKRPSWINPAAISRY